MSHPFKPDDYNSLSPYLIVPGAQKLIDLLQEVFDAKAIRRFDREDGTIMHAEVMIDDSVVMLSDSTAVWPGNQLLLHVYVPNVDEVFAKAIQLGCQALEEPQTKEGDPDRRGMFEDFAGNQWAVSTQNHTSEI